MGVSARNRVSISSSVSPSSAERAAVSVSASMWALSSSPAVRQRTLACQQTAPGQAVGAPLPLVVVVVAAASDELRGHAAGRAVQDVGLAAADARRHQRRDVPVSAVLAQQSRGVPELFDGFCRPGQRGVGGEQRPTVHRGRGGRLRAQFGRGSHVVVVGHAVAAQGRHREASRVRSASAGAAIDQAAGSALATRVGEKL